MIASLRARLWVSYAILIVMVLVVVAAALLVMFVRNPRLLYPEAVIRLQLVDELILNRLSQVDNPDDLLNVPNLERIQEEFSKRGFWLARANSQEGLQVVIATDSEPPALRMLSNIRRGLATEGQVSTLRAVNGHTWLYIWHQLDSQSEIIIATQEPFLPIRVLLRNDFFASFIYAGIAALVLSFLLALWLGGSITSPLRKMVSASQAVARGENPSVSVEGPLEVRELAEAMNEMSQRVQNMQQSQRDFVANVSHDLKTPLTSIQGFAQAILDGAAQRPEALQQAAGVIYAEAERMHRLVLDLLSLARLEAGTADLQREPVSLAPLLQAVVERLSPQARDAQVTLRTDLVDLEATLSGDGDRLAQVYNNLVENAIKFTPAGGQVVVSLHREPDGWLTAVQDSGKGIAPEDQTRIFERFYQVDRSRPGGGGRGVGLGLPIARQIVLAHGGQIWVESGPGQGSRFVVKLPLQSSSEVSAAKKNKGKG